VAGPDFRVLVTVGLDKVIDEVRWPAMRKPSTFPIQWLR